MMLKIRLITFLALLLITFVAYTHNAHALDTTPPTTTYVQTPSSPNGNNGWYITPVKFDLSATDLESGVQDIWYRIDSGAWQNTHYSDTLNLVQNPSFEIGSSSETGVDKWDATKSDSAGVYTQDTSNYAPGYSVASVSIVAPGGNWHGLNDMNYFAVTTPYQNMSASVWLKTLNLSSTAYFSIYAVSLAGNGHYNYTLVSQSSTLTGTNDWTRLSTSFTVNVADAIGVYIDIGYGGSGSLWIDAATINSSSTSATTSVTIASDNAAHTFEFYSVDNVGNAETHSCTGTIKNCISFKLDQTPPGNWANSGAYRGQGGSDHELYVYTNVDDATSGLAAATNKYQYHTDTQPGFGRYTDLIKCNTTWLPDTWTSLSSPSIPPGSNTAYLLTQKTDFCNDNWKVCKTVRFYAEDMAGNFASKDLCINGPWIQLSNNGVVRSNFDISMISDPGLDNTDGLIEAQGGNVSFFSSSDNWVVKNAETLPTTWDYNKFSTSLKSKTTVASLPATTGTYLINNGYTISSLPSGYTTSTFNQIVFVNGDLTISTNISIAANSTALFIVKGKVSIAKAVTTVKAAIMTDGDFYTAYDINQDEATPTLNLYGVYSANVFHLQRTLQGTNNSTTPSESFYYEPKYAINLRNSFGSYAVTWKSSN
ncbi:MAG TPA: hypothetical protein VLI92_01030 [Candidatus Saccharimonadales bacterium]|nr:hypothetical protein [Candidatus Saccharimonadales bacterium]